MTEPGRWHDTIATLTRHIPPGQFIRYFVMGGFNTLFGYTTFAVLTWLLNKFLPQSYLFAVIPSALINITVAWLGYKVFVFRTRGNYLREWLRCVGVYGSGMVVGTILLPIAVFLIRLIPGTYEAAPYLAAAILTAANVLLTFVGHSKFSFRPGPSPPPSDGPPPSPRMTPPTV